MDLVQPAQAMDALVAGGRLTEAAALARAAIAARRAPAEGMARLRLRLTGILMAAGQTGPALAEAGAVLAEPDLPEEVYDAAELGRLYTLLMLDELSRAQTTAEAILAGRHRGGGDAALAGALSVLGRLAWDEGRIGVAVGLARAAVQRTVRGRVVDHQPRVALADMLTLLGEYEEARSVIMAGERDGGGLQAPWAGSPTLLLARLAMARGRLDEGLARAESAVAGAEGRGVRLLLPFTLATAALAAVLRGDLPLAARYVRRYRMESALPHAGVRGLAGLWARARVAEAQRGAPAAMRLLADQFDRLPARPGLLMGEASAAAWLTRVALAVGDWCRAETAVSCARQLAAANPGNRWAGASAAHAQGLLDRDPGLLAEAAAHYPQPWAAASAAEDAGVLLADRGEHRPARDALQRALTGYEEIGADRDAARLRRRLGEVDAEPAQPARRCRPASGWLSLTETERRVAALVAEGLTNAQVAERMFLSRHTIDFHLRKIFCRLDIRSRVELTRVMVQTSVNVRP